MMMMMRWMVETRVFLFETEGWLFEVNGRRVTVSPGDTYLRDSWEQLPEDADCSLVPFVDFLVTRVDQCDDV